MVNRLPPVPGEWIDRTQTICFNFEGSSYWGYRGDTISSALWAANVRILGCSFKYHRPRGILSFANHDINALMQSGQKLNVRADVTPLESGVSLSAVHTFGGVRSDRARVLDYLSAFLPVGFYYKAFYNKQLFPFWERLIRRITGLGRVDFTTPRIHTPKRYDFCDLLVVGAGLSGLSAAIAAANAGADVVIVDENAKAGGSGGYQLGGNLAQLDRLEQLLESIYDHPRIRLYTNTQASGYYADHWVPLLDSDRLTKMRAKAVIIASGAYEQPAVFRNNDLPGVMLASAAQRLIYRYAVKPMRRAVVLTANQDGYRAALDLIQNQVQVQAIVDLRHVIPQSEIIDQLQHQQVAILPGWCLYEARSNSISEGVSDVVICSLDSDGKPQKGSQQTITCDGVVISVGWAPAANLLYQAGALMRFDHLLQQFIPDVLPDGVFAAGRVNGVYDPEQKQQDGHRAGLEAAAYLGLHTAEIPQLEWTETEAPSHPWAIVEHSKGKNFVDFDEDLQLKDFINATQEGFDNIELLKRYTTVGMGPSQGKHSNMNALRILAAVTQQSPGAVGTTTSRPFFQPVPLSHLAGRGFTPKRQTPLHSRHNLLGATWMLGGIWHRPDYYSQPKLSRADCIAREVNLVRTSVGVVDVGTLGKLEIRGVDAAEFLERVYTGRFANLKVGMSRYALRVDEAGVIIDDGVVARLATDLFYCTTTTSSATQSYRELSRLNVIWQLDCNIVNLTGARAAVNLAGIPSRAVLSQLTDLDLSSTSFPYLAVRQAEVAGISALLMRVGFVGEWGYEIHVAAEFAPALWDALFSVGTKFGIQPFGIEAQRLLRLEKGHLIVGQDTDGLTTPFEAGLEWAVKFDKPFFVGQRSLQIIQRRPLQQTLVGFMLDEQFQATSPQECYLIINHGEIAGRVTSIAFSPTLKRHIGLAYLRSELSSLGNRFSIRLSNGELVTAIVCRPPFYDPDNLRQKETEVQQPVTA